VSDDVLGDFESHRDFLTALAYRMLGSVAESDDVVQDAYLRWRDVDRASVTEPRAFLARVVSRLCLDHLKSARHRREEYVGTWLPEPIVAAPAETLADDLSVALLLALERLSPLERAAFLLHDVFDMDYAGVATTLETTEGACRQLASRARQHVRQDRARHTASETEAREIAGAFVAAAATGDVARLARLLADDAVLYTDGGGKRRAALRPIEGKERIARFYDGVRKKFGDNAFAAERVEEATLNGLPGFVFHTGDETETLALEIAGGVIVAIYSVRNPDKVRHLA
jgi:RNA polymerase sigma-70 factor (ECF subfamily)